VPPPDTDLHGFTLLRRTGNITHEARFFAPLRTASVLISVEQPPKPMPDHPGHGQRATSDERRIFLAFSDVPTIISFVLLCLAIAAPPTVRIYCGSQTTCVIRYTKIEPSLPRTKLRRINRLHSDASYAAPVSFPLYANRINNS